MEEERRREPRRRMLKAGRIVFGSLSRTYDCTLRNTSSGGALLLVPNSLGVPDAFLLYVESEGTRRPAEIVWRLDDRIGIRFTGSSEEIPARI
jgi:hypothetical protein